MIRIVSANFPPLGEDAKVNTGLCPNLTYCPLIKLRVAERRFILLSKRNVHKYNDTWNVLS